MGYFPKKHIAKRKVFSEEDKSFGGNAWTTVQVKSFDVDVFFVKYLSVANYLFVVFLNINQPVELTIVTKSRRGSWVNWGRGRWIWGGAEKQWSKVNVVGGSGGGGGWLSGDSPT